jgi:hypothetical protein
MHATRYSTAQVITAQCRRCSKWRSLDEFVAGGPQDGYCLRCLEWHRAALDHLATGKTPSGCQECERSLDELSRAAGSADVKMYLHPKDGIYQVLCGTCSDRYEQKRRDLYARTSYGQKKLSDAN